MGIIGEAFGWLFNFLGGLFGSLFGVIWDGIKWLGRSIGKLFQGLIDILIGFFNVIYGLIDGILYLLFMIGVLAVKLFQLLYGVAKVLYALVVGVGATLSSLNYQPQASANNGYSEVISRLFNNLGVLQLDGIAYIILFGLWFFTGLSAIKILSSFRAGGE